MTYSVAQPQRRVLQPDQLLELLHPHTPPDDVDWPTPTDRRTVEHLLDRMPYNLMLTCLETAVQTVRPALDDWTVTEPDPHNFRLSARQNGQAFNASALQAQTLAPGLFAGQIIGDIIWALRETCTSVDFVQRWWTRCRCRLAFVFEPPRKMHCSCCVRPVDVDNIPSDRAPLWSPSNLRQKEPHNRLWAYSSCVLCGGSGITLA